MLWWTLWSSKLQLRSGDSLVRSHAAEALGKTSDVRAIEPLIDALKDSEWVVRSAAAQALGNISDVRAVEPLIDALKDSEKFMRGAVMEVLEKIPDHRAVASLIVALKNSNKDVRKKAAIILGKIGDLRAVEPLIDALKDSEWDVRSIVTMALGEIRDVRAVEPLLESLKDSNVNVRKEAARTLGKIGDVRAVEPLIVALRDSNENMRQSAAEALKALRYKPSDETQEAMMFVANKEWDNAVKLGAVAVEPLIVALKDSEENYVREAATEALGKIGDVRAIEPLIVALKDSIENVRQSAAEALVKLGIVAVEPLIDALKDSNEKVRKEAASILGKIGDVRAVEPLIDALKDPKINVRKAATEALGKIGDDQNKESLIPLLKDHDCTVRQAATDALEQVNSPEVKKSLSEYRRIANAREEAYDLASKVAGGWPAELDRAKLLAVDFKALVQRLRKYLQMTHPGGFRRPEYQLVSGQVARVGKPSEDFALATAASMLAGKARVVTPFDDAASQFAYQVIQEYGGWRLAKFLFSIPRCLDMQAKAKPGPTTIVIEDFIVDVYSGTENLLFEIYEELAVGEVMDDARVRRKLKALAYS